VLDNHKDNPVLSTDVWHSDTTFRANPTKYTILRCQIMPKVGGLGQSVDPALRSQRLLSRTLAHGAHGCRRRRAILSTRARNAGWIRCCREADYVNLTASEERRGSLWPPSPLAGEGNFEGATERRGEGGRYPSPIRACCDLDAALSRKGTRKGRGHDNRHRRPLHRL
jgi:hypothetical protein